MRQNSNRPMKVKNNKCFGISRYGCTTDDVELVIYQHSYLLQTAELTLYQSEIYVTCENKLKKFKTAGFVTT